MELLRSCLRREAHLLVDIALATGLRWGELAALRRGDLPFPDDPTLRIHALRAGRSEPPTTIARWIVRALSSLLVLR